MNAYFRIDDINTKTFQQTDFRTGRSHRIHDSSVNIEKKLPDLSSLSLCEKNNTATNCSGRQIKLHHSKPEATTLGFTGAKEPKPESQAILNSRKVAEINQKFHRQYSWHADTIIGKGNSTGAQFVIEVRERKTDCFYVAKPIMKQLSNRKQPSKPKEVEILEALRCDKHKNIAHLIDISGDFLIMENGGLNLEAHMKNANKLSEEMIAQVMYQLINVLCYLDGKGIIHGDIKPDNLLYQGGCLKLCDFGISRRTGEKIDAQVPISYTPLEFFNNPVVSNTDMWSAGCVFYKMVAGEILFPAEFMLNKDGSLKVSDKEIESRVQAGKKIILQRLGEDAKDLFQKMMVPLSSDRLTPDQAKNHPYIIKSREDISRVRSGPISTNGLVAKDEKKPAFCLFHHSGVDSNHEQILNK